MVAGVWSESSNLQLEATTQFRKLLSIGIHMISFVVFVFGCLLYIMSDDIDVKNQLAERSPPIEEVIQSGVVPRFVEFLVREDFPQLQVGVVLVYIVVCLLADL